MRGWGGGAGTEPSPGLQQASRLQMGPALTLPSQHHQSGPAAEPNWDAWEDSLACRRPTRVVPRRRGLEEEHSSAPPLQGSRSGGWGGGRGLAPCKDLPGEAKGGVQFGCLAGDGCWRHRSGPSLQVKSLEQLPNRVCASSWRRARVFLALQL